MPTKHALLSPSGAHRWLNCQGSLLLESQFENTTSDAAIEGTTAHALAEICLTENKAPADFLGKILEEGFVEVDKDMVEYISTYIQEIRSAAQGSILHIEEKVDISPYLEQKDVFGTVDALIISNDEIQVHDLKYGMGVKVDAKNNEQLQMYALGAYALYQFGFDIKQVRMVIHQVRLNSISEWVISIDDLLKFGEKAKQKAAQVIAIYDSGELKKQDFNPQDKTCKFCKAKAHCKALAQHVADLVADDFVNLDEEIDLSSGINKLATCDNSHIAKLLPQLDLIDGFTKAVRTRATSELLSGNEIPGYKLVAGRKGARKWTDEERVEQELRKLAKVSDIYTKKLITPTVATKLFKNAPKKIARLQDFIIQAEGSPSVVPETDKRPTLVTNEVADDFDNLNQP
ncbi:MULTISPECIES: DUF2800 domain-containing protein [Pasteurellaceae]|uniref:DUF2800 domain-containing protein n=1 Tax=Pasteurella atlantica TaxID=2827233 RepID=A0AAW8CNT9_9PAST|nr:DUF2800 domain-containing protein [Pasteurella atlantica]MBR0574180.1 DUF2800 domain-containing protein [Pasteurella atlantica]MDP8039289.1 DUF2800 domain-containing protein [Pasteurella atlantica]MDP8041381.1 DUF2800 domain-containing protein [Pasteurella atlantica]MDP8043517.1 DUF2800 domain-containing protein [Pasteurella atlantica]MDP8045565.1 DUF2800 domain-containing protein [Pasteurella atlantica]